VIHRGDQPLQQLAASSTTILAPQQVLSTSTSSFREERTGAAEDETQRAEPVYVIIHLLGEITVEVLSPDGSKREAVSMKPSEVRRELLAYLAWQRGKTIPRDFILRDVFQHRLTKEDERDEDERLKNLFSQHNKNLRGDINQVAARLGHETRLRVTEYDSTEWWLADYCIVPDLDEVEAQWKVIDLAARAGKLETVAVRDACDRLIAAYPGDFLEKQVKNHEYDTQSWVRGPFTLYRDYMLAALWYRAEYERIAGDRIGKDIEESRYNSQDEISRAKAEQGTYYDRAADFYRRYALYAPSTRFDTKVYGKEPGERIRLSERALRWAIRMYSLSREGGNLQAADGVFETYKKVLIPVYRSVHQDWKPSKETEKVLENARAMTTAHQFSMRITPLDTAAEQDAAEAETVE
jgi:hypothetical protein